MNRPGLMSYKRNHSIFLNAVLAFFIFLSKPAYAELTPCDSIRTAIIKARQSSNSIYSFIDSIFSVSGVEYRVDFHYGSKAYRVVRIKDDVAFQAKLSEVTRRATDYEYWATLYYKENGLDVLDVLGPPQNITLGGRAYSVLLKPAVEGISYAEFLGSPLSHEEKSKLDRELMILMSKYQVLHERGRFASWLRKQGIVDFNTTFDVWTLKIPSGDIHQSDFLLTDHGWQLIDP